ncbi:hypothetical protein RR46_00641 [Papilio xuthus]|uniref:Uncharacterized protein n=1 Tax=Papilio xuthus TaxID=66420 RepID=A0A0N1I5C2_PAPXU|nr:hypothetical protein RR46_00641 [Papilio xuthus]
MSIKSQKSLNEECSEIFEKSYSVRSLSEESLSTEDEETDSLCRELLRKMSPAALTHLRRRFKRGRQTQHNVNRKVEEVMVAAALQEGVQFATPDPPAAPTDALWLDEDSFVAAIDDIFGGHKFNTHARQLCVALDPLRTGRVHWTALLARLLPAPRPPRAPALAHKPSRLPHAQDAGCVAYATSERCVRVFAAPGHAHAHAQLHCITGLPDLPTCMSYSESSSGFASSLLLAGTGRGAVCALRFYRPRAALLQHDPDSLSYACWTDLCSGAQRSYCSARVLPSHSRAVRRLACERDGRRFVSCSQDAEASLRLRHSSPHLDDYIAKVQRGVSCFHVSWSQRLVAGGGADGVLRLWQMAPPVPLARLSLPAPPPLVDVAIIAHLEIVIGFHNNCTLNLWDLREETLLQTIKIKFPFLGALGKKLEFGAYCIHPGPPRKKEGTEEQPTQSPSRRGSQVYQGSTGGLLLEDDETSDGFPGDIKSDPEYVRFNVSEILVTCCEHVCRVTLGGARATGPVLRPPGDALRPRRPSYWDLPDDFVNDHDISVPDAVCMNHKDKEPKDISRLLEGAGLQGLLEKDFVLMQGFKNDLNKKLHHMKTDMDTRRWAVRCGAPHLALRPHSPPPLPPPRDRLQDYLAQLTLEFPPPSVTVTPSASSSSTPAHTRTVKP